MRSFKILASRILHLLKAEVEFSDLFQLLQEAGPLQAKLYRNHPGPKISLEYDYWGNGQLVTSIPGLAYTDEAYIYMPSKLTTDEQDELRTHLTKIVQLWLDQDNLFTRPMEKRDVAKALDINLKTLKRHIESGIITAVEMNKALVRVLKTDLPE